LFCSEDVKKISIKKIINAADALNDAISFLRRSSLTGAFVLFFAIVVKPFCTYS
jgi:hypothetical protein